MTPLSFGSICSGGSGGGARVDLFQSHIFTQATFVH